MARGRKKKGKTGQQSKGGGDDNVGLDVPNHNGTNCGDGNDDVLDENRNNEGGNDVCDDANNVGKSCDGDNGDGDNSDGIVNNIGGNDSNDVGNPPDSGELSAKEKRKGKQYSNLREEVKTIVDLMDLTIMKLTAAMAITMFLVGTEKKKEAKMFEMTTIMLARLVMVTMVMVTTVMALSTILVALTAMMLLTHLTVVMLLVKSTVSVMPTMLASLVMVTMVCSRPVGHLQ
jgi:hypothetical protein